MDFFHLSHTDLDGFTCQFISKTAMKDGYFVNANYGEEVRVRIDEILAKIEESGSQEAFFLITDLNLTLEEASYLDERIKNMDKKVKLQLLDHHASGLETAEKFEWYHLDVLKSASMITYQYFPKSMRSKLWIPSSKRSMPLISGSKRIHFSNMAKY